MNRIMKLAALGLVLAAFAAFQANNKEKAEATAMGKTVDELRTFRAAEAAKAEQQSQAFAVWCQENKGFIQDGLHSLVLKINDGYPVTTATVSYPFWKTLNETMRKGALAAIRCSSLHKDSLIKIVDLNGVALD